MSCKFDIYNIDNGNFFKEKRMIFIYGEINEQTAFDVTTKIKYLDYLDSDKEITIEINSYGGDVLSGLAIIDTMKCVAAPIKIIVSGLAASMAALIASAGTKGLRYALPHSSIMIHQPLGGVRWAQATDIQIYANNITKTKQMINELLASNTNQSIQRIEKDMERDYYMTAKEAVEYGIIDHVIQEKGGKS